ncbi:MAG: restriction endonuclease subunit S [Nitrospirae bacterium]|nr:restriction endonuclease subunit S [Nitrospirota bacterium]
MFIERIWHFLKPGTGRAAVVLPDGILTNASLQYVRDFILERFQLLAVVSLPQTAFAHFGAGVKASVVFLRKRADGETPDDNEAIFMAAPEKIGYDATGRKCENQLPEVATQYREFLRKPGAFFRLNPVAEGETICIAENRGMIKDGKLSVLWLHNKKNQIFEESGYELVKISDLGMSFTGSTPSKENEDYWSGDIAWVSPKDIKEPLIRGSKDKISETGLMSARLKIVPERSILFTMRGLSDSSRLAGMNLIPVTINQDVRALIPTNIVNPEYLVYLLDVYQDQILSLIKKHSTTVQSIDAIALADFRIPLPPIEIQNKLAGEMKAAREKAIYLRLEAARTLEDAKARFEAELLGNA